jgi:hypothetical protein
MENENPPERTLLFAMKISGDNGKERGNPQNGPNCFNVERGKGKGGREEIENLC